MWRRRKKGAAPEQASTSVIDQGCEVTGRLTCVGTLVLNGKFRGELLSSDTLLVGEAGQVQAEVQANIAIVNGQITGSINARERVELRGSARIHGDIVTPVLILGEGVVFDGHCKMKGEELPAAQEIS